MAAATRWSLIKDIIGAALFIVLGGVVYRQLGELPPQAAKYPAIIVCFIIGLCIILTVKAAAALAGGRYAAPVPAEAPADGAPAEEGDKFGFPTVLVLVMSFLYVFAMPYIGFTLSSGLMMILFMLAVGIRSPYILILVPVIEIAFLLYVFEKLLAVFLPGADPLRALLGIG